MQADFAIQSNANPQFLEATAAGRLEAIVISPHQDASYSVPAISFHFELMCAEICVSPYCSRLHHPATKVIEHAKAYRHCTVPKTPSSALFTLLAYNSVLVWLSCPISPPPAEAKPRPRSFLCLISAAANHTCETAVLSRIVNLTLVIGYPPTIPALSLNHASVAWSVVDKVVACLAFHGDQEVQCRLSRRILSCPTGRPVSLPCYQSDQGQRMHYSTFSFVGNQTLVSSSSTLLVISSECM
ncbi:hypothetical protein BCV70DRAFT_47608 [Testicularia cyperi]|uniref:Uncharacterized protein n=1 Tax=Testicularia cyperi TaxID=1882483 RepID=A0A317XHS6_9BASI|nr:hypothetical protein BCV70DRAFT_47608 [Testicularia cyperi]